MVLLTWNRLRAACGALGTLKRLRIVVKSAFTTCRICCESSSMVVTKA